TSRRLMATPRCIQVRRYRRRHRRPTSSQSRFVTEQQPRTRIGQRSILVALLVPAVIVGWIVGTLLGSASNPAASPSPTPTPTPAPTPKASGAPSVAPSTSASPTSTISSSAGPAVSTAPVLKLEGTGNQRSETFQLLGGWP